VPKATHKVGKTSKAVGKAVAQYRKRAEWVVRVSRSLLNCLVVAEFSQPS
jgi:hypothetical protein